MVFRFHDKHMQAMASAASEMLCPSTWYNGQAKAVHSSTRDGSLMSVSSRLRNRCHHKLTIHIPCDSRDTLDPAGPSSMPISGDKRQRCRMCSNVVAQHLQPPGSPQLRLTQLRRGGHNSAFPSCAWPETISQPSEEPGACPLSLTSRPRLWRRDMRKKFQITTTRDWRPRGDNAPIACSYRTHTYAWIVQLHIAFTSQPAVGEYCTGNHRI